MKPNVYHLIRKEKMYIIPQQYKCPKCGFECNYSPSEIYTFLPIDRDTNDPFCYACLIDFIKNNVPIMIEVDN